MGSQALFVATDSTGDFGLWVDDGTASGTTELETGQQGAYSLWPSNFVVIGGRAYFLATDSTGKVGVWTTDGDGRGHGRTAVRPTGRLRRSCRRT